MEYKRGVAGKEVGTKPEPMDQQAASHEIADDSSVSMPVPGPETPLNWLQIIIYSALILLATALLFCSIVALAALVLAAILGRDGMSDFMIQRQFDVVLQARIGAAKQSDIYVSMATATLIAARLIGRQRWRSILAIAPIKRGRGITLALSIATLVYAAVVTLAITTMQNHRLVDSGPTDLILLGAFMANLCLLAPIAEELFFRGWLYTALRGKFAFWPSYLFTTSLFAAIHWYASVTHMLKVLPLAVVLGLVREWKGSIKPTIALHAVYNLTIVLITLAET